MLRACFFILVMNFSALGAAAELYKCRDHKGRITYSSVNCKSQGLRSAGAIQDRTMVMPTEQFRGGMDEKIGRDKESTRERKPASPPARAAKRRISVDPEDENATPERRGGGRSRR